jgi:hypothetical protein
MDNFKRLASVLRWKNPQAAVLIIAAVHLGIFSPTAAGCECAPLPPPCVAYTYTEMIFLGTVTELEKGVAQMRIDKAYKGVLVKTVALWDTGMCLGPALHVGEQYLIYTRDDGIGYLLSGGCTRSRNARDAKEDMAFLNGLSKAPLTSTVFGQVTVRSGSISSEGEPVPGAVVEIQVEGKSRKSTRTGKGAICFWGSLQDCTASRRACPDSDKANPKVTIPRK